MQLSIKEIQDKYKLAVDDFWELPAKPGTWMIKHQALEHIAEVEKIVLDAPVVMGYRPTIEREEGVKKEITVRGKTKHVKEMIGPVAVERGEIILYVVGHTPEGATAWATGEANALNCTAPYYAAMAEKRAKDRVIIKLINSTDDIYSDVEGVPTGDQSNTMEASDKEIATKEEAIAKLRECKTQDELKGVFVSLGTLIGDPEVIAVKDEMKGKLSNETN